MEMPTAPGSQTLGRYRLHDEIVSGGMGVVHFGSVKAGAGHRVVAIKRLHPSLVSERELKDAFVREAGLAVRIRHPNVVPTLEVGVHGDEVFVVMEYLHGESLARLMKAGRGPAPPGIATRVVADVLSGLSAVHDARDDSGDLLGVVHRDVSPQNVLVGVDGTAFIIDFGIAKVAGDATNTRPGLVKGKLSYMSPEQLKAGEVTPATDLFATSVVLWEMLTGMRLFATGSVGSLMRRIAEGRIEPPSVHAPGVSPELDAIVLRGLRPVPSERYRSAGEFAERLVAAYSPASRDEVARWVRERAGAVLDERARMVEGITGYRPRDGKSTRAPTPRAGRGRALVVAAAIAGLLVVVVVVVGSAYWSARNALGERAAGSSSTELVQGTARDGREPNPAVSGKDWLDASVDVR